MPGSRTGAGETGFRALGRLTPSPIGHGRGTVAMAGMGAAAAEGDSSAVAEQRCREAAAAMV